MWLSIRMRCDVARGTGPVGLRQPFDALKYDRASGTNAKIPLRRSDPTQDRSDALKYTGAIQTECERGPVGAERNPATWTGLEVISKGLRPRMAYDQVRKT